MAARNDGRRRGHTGLVALLVLVVGLVAALVVADVMVRRAVQHRIESELASRLGHSVTAQVQGPSALYALATDHWQGIHVQGQDAQLSYRDVQVPADLDVTLTDVTGLLRGSRATAGGVAGTIDVPWTGLGKAVGATLSGSDQGTVTASTTTNILGQDRKVVVEGKPSVAVAQQQIQIGNPVVTIDGQRASDVVANALMPAVQERLQLPTYPGVQVTSLRTTAADAIFTVKGTDVSVSR